MTEEIIVQLNGSGRGAFVAIVGDEQLGEMDVSVNGNDLTVYHTEVSPKGEGKGLAKKMLAAMVEHARKNSLKVIPLCPFVQAQFKHNPDMYADVWKKASGEKEKA